MPFSGALTATVFVCVSMTLLMGIYARLPFVVAPGMGINAFFAYTIILRDGVPWPTAFGLVFWAGVLFLLVSTTRVREAVATAIPGSLRGATAAGIGMLIALIGLRNGGFIAADPVTIVTLGPLDHRTFLTLIGLGVTAWLVHRGHPTAFLAGIFAVSGIAWVAGFVAPPSSIFSAPDFSSVFLKLDVWGALQLSLMPALVALVFTDLFDSLATFIGVSQVSGLVDEHGHPIRLRQRLIVDALATVGAGLAGTSSGTAYAESVSGIRAGGRTGVTAIVTALCFVPCFFVAPLAGAVPAYATSAVLIMVGAAMFQPIAQFAGADLEDAVPGFITAVLIPLTSSITMGILWGFVFHVTMYVLVGRQRDVPPMMYALAAVAVGLLLLEAGR